MRRIVLKNHKNENVRLSINLDKLGNIRKMMVLVIGGDEVLLVIRKDDSEIVYDTGVKRDFDEFNYKYILYDSNYPDEALLDRFMARSDSMEMKDWIRRRRTNEMLQDMRIRC